MRIENYPALTSTFVDIYKDRDNFIDLNNNNSIVILYSDYISVLPISITDPDCL